MGTRGMIGFISQGNERFSYQQFDSYPSGVGTEVAEFCDRLSESWSINLGMVHAVANLTQVNSESPKPSEAVIKELEPFTNLRVSDQSTEDWYCLVRNTQGHPEMILKSGYCYGDKEFGDDPLFCEWAYIIDFDNNVLDVYTSWELRGREAGMWGPGGILKTASFPFGECRHGMALLVREAEGEDLLPVEEN